MSRLIKIKTNTNRNDVNAQSENLFLLDFKNDLFTTKKKDR